MRTVALVAAVAMLATVPAFAAPAPVGSADGVQVAAGPTSPSQSTTGAPKSKFQTELERRQAKLNQLKAELDALDLQLEVATDSYNKAMDDLTALKSRLATTEVDLANAKAAYAIQADVLAKRAAALYQTGDTNTLEIVMGSKSLPDFFRRLEFLGVIGKSDADLAQQLAAQRDQIEGQAASLAEEKTKAEAAEFELKTRKRQIELTIGERQQMLANAEADLLKMLDSEAARRRTSEAALLADVMKNASKYGIDMTPGGPVETALAYHGIPYVWGGESPKGMDCSGLVLYVFRQHGVTLPHYSGSQFLLGEKVAVTDLRAGDVVFFGNPIHHVGIYIGGGYYIHAPKTGDFVKISKLADRGDFAGARRYPWQLRNGPIQGLNEISPNVDHSHGVQGIYGGTR